MYCEKNNIPSVFWGCSVEDNVLTEKSLGKTWQDTITLLQENHFLMISLNSAKRKCLFSM